MDPLSEEQQQHTVSPAYFNFSGESKESESSVRENVAATTRFITPLLVAFVALGFVGNIIILHAICTVKRFNRAENLMLANLSVSSVLIIISTISLYIQTTFPLNIYGPLYCKLYPGFHSFMFTAQGFTMICISLERIQRVRYPLTRATMLSAMKKIGLIWTLALLSELPRGLLFYQYDPKLITLRKCYNTKQLFGTLVPFVVYVTTNYLLAFLMPSCWLARDWIRLVSQLHFLFACQTLPLRAEYRKRQKKLIGHAIIFTSIFIAVKVPCGTHMLLYQLPPELLSESVFAWGIQWKPFFFGAQVLHGSFYPFIIFALSGDIRKYLSCSEWNRRRDTHSPPEAQPRNIYCVRQHR